MTPLTLFNQVYFKREDLNLTGSAKDRAISLQVDQLVSQGYSSAVISSTGNAAISAQYFCQKHHIPLTIFVSPHTDQSKLKLLHQYTISDQPISAAIKFSKSNNSYLLRQSTDPTAILGYQPIGLELIHQLPNLTSIFIPVGSGTTLLGLAQSLPKSVKIFAVQSAFNPTITKHFNPNFTPETINLTDALTVKYLPLKSAVIKATTNGFTLQNSDILQAQKELKDYPFSPETALCYAAYIQNKSVAGDYPVILVTGTKR